MRWLLSLSLLLVGCVTGGKATLGIEHDGTKPKIQLECSMEF